MTFLDAEAEKDLNPLFLIFTIPAILMYIIGCFGLWRLKKWGFYTYAISQILFLASFPITEYYFMTGYGGMFHEIVVIIIGATIMLGYIKILKTA